jgi:hypothetical protein
MCIAIPARQAGHAAYGLEHVSLHFSIRIRANAALCPKPRGYLVVVTSSLSFTQGFLPNSAIAKDVVLLERKRYARDIDKMVLSLSSHSKLDPANGSRMVIVDINVECYKVKRW